MAINWGGAAQNNNPLAYFAMGQQMGQQIVDRKVNSAAARYAQGDQNALADVMKYDAGMGMQLQARQGQIQQQQAQAQRERLIQTAKLFDGVTPENYGERLSIAQKMGIDISTAPQVYDPAWVQENQQIMRLAVDKPEQLSGIARELIDAGYREGTPEFLDAMKGVINNKYAAEYIDEQGNTRRRSALNLSGPSVPPSPNPTVPAQDPITFDMYMSAAKGMGPQGSLEWIRQNNIPVRVATPQQASQLPRGTRLILPDGTEGVVP